MDIQKLTDLLVTSSENCSQAMFIPWWKDDFTRADYRYSMLEKDVIQEAGNCLADCGRDVLFSPVGHAGFTLAHLLVWHNFHDLVEGMIREGRITGEDINMPDHCGHGCTLLHLACSRGNLAMTRLLLEHGAREDVCDERGMNAYHFLAYPRFPEEVPVLDPVCLENSVKQRGDIARLLTCDINQRDRDGLTPLERLLSTEYSASYTWPLTEAFLEKGARTDYVDPEGNTLLMMARRNGHRTAALQLMEQCPELVDVANNQGITPLQHAMDFRNQGMYLALLDHGATPAPGAGMDRLPLQQVTGNAFGDVERDNRDGLSLALYLTEKLIRQVDPDDEDELGEVAGILHNALISDEEANVLDACRDTGIDFTMPVLYEGEMLCLRDECLRACYGIGALRRLAELGVDMDKAVIRGRTPAHILAAGRGQEHGEGEEFYTEATVFFARESMEQTDKGGKTALHLAVENGHTGMVRAMLEKGVDVDLTVDEPGEAGVTALHLACSNGFADMVELLLEAGADDTLQTYKGESPAHYVLLGSKHGGVQDMESRIQILNRLEHLDIPDEEGITPLLLVSYDTRELLPLLINRGVDVNHGDLRGVTALMRNTDKELAKELLKAGADVNRTDIQGDTALHYALRAGAEGDARYLIRKGADYNRPNNQGETPAQIAVEEGLDTVLELMTDIV